MLSLMLDMTYAVVLMVATPFLLYRRFVQKKAVAGLVDKLTGRIVRRHPDRPCVWFHAVSVGEVLQLPSLVAEIAARHPRHELLITTTTGTGFDVAREKFPQHTVAYWPLDFSWAVHRALSTVRPDRVVLVELELWPNFLLAARRLSIPVLLVNGRIGAKSFRGYQRLKWLWRRVLPALTRCAVQTEEYAQRLIDLGVPGDRVTVTGNIKYDRVLSDRQNPKTEELRQAFGIASDELVFIAGSTQETEEEAALIAWEAVRNECPNLRLILVPRHKERFDAVAKLVESRGHILARRSTLLSPLPPSSLGEGPGVRVRFSLAQVPHSKPQSQAGNHPHPNPLPARTPGEGTRVRPVCLLDTLGELAACWGLADIAFVGGSLTNRGGQNMLEPAGYGAAVLFGPNTWNFQDIVEQLLARDAAVVVHSGDALREMLLRLLRNPKERQEFGDAAQAFVLRQRGALAKTVAVIEEHLVHENPRSRAA